MKSKFKLGDKVKVIHYFSYGGREFNEGMVGVVRSLAGSTHYDTASWQHDKQRAGTSWNIPYDILDNCCELNIDEKYKPFRDAGLQETVCNEVVFVTNVHTDKVIWVMTSGTICLNPYARIRECSRDIANLLLCAERYKVKLNILQGNDFLAHHKDAGLFLEYNGKKRKYYDGMMLKR